MNRLFSSEGIIIDNIDYNLKPALRLGKSWLKLIVAANLLSCIMACPDIKAAKLQALYYKMEKQEQIKKLEVQCSDYPN